MPIVTGISVQVPFPAKSRSFTNERSDAKHGVKHLRFRLGRATPHHDGDCDTEGAYLDSCHSPLDDWAQIGLPFSKLLQELSPLDMLIIAALLWFDDVAAGEKGWPLYT